MPSQTECDNLGRYVANQYIVDSSSTKGSKILTSSFTADRFDPADILYTFEGYGKIAVEVKTRNGIYPTYFYEVTKDNRLQEYRKQGYTLIYANVIEDNGKLYMWNVTDISKVKGVQTKLAPCFVSTFNNPKITGKFVYTLPVSSAFINVDATEYIKQYKTLSNAND